MVRAQFCDLVADARELAASASPAYFRSCTATGRRRGGALLPDRVDRIALDRHQLRARLGAGGLQPFDCRRRVQPRVESEAVAGLQFLRDPFPAAARPATPPSRRLCRSAGRPAGCSGRPRTAPHGRSAGCEPAEPVKPVSQASRRPRAAHIRSDGVGAGNHESGRFLRASSSRSAARRAAAPAAFRVFERLELRFEHGLI